MKSIILIPMVLILFLSCKHNQNGETGGGSALESNRMSCVSPPFAPQPVIGQISPKKAREILKSSDISVEPKLSHFRDKAILMEALQLGLEIQQLGCSEAMVYAVDSLYFIAGGKLNSGSSEQRSLYNLYQTNFRADTALSFPLACQIAAGIRIAGSLFLLKRTDEAQKLIGFLKGNPDPSTVQDLRQHISNTGSISSQTNSSSLCTKIMAL